MNDHFSPDVWIWDVNAQTLLRRIPGGDLAFSPDGTVLAVVNRQEIAFWECATGRKLESLPWHSTLIGFLPDGKSLITMEMSGRILFWDRASKQVTFAFDAIADLSRPGWPALTPDGSCLALPTTANQARLWLFDSASREAVYLDSVPADYGVGLAFSPDGTYLATLVTRKRSTWVRLYHVQKQEDQGDLEPGVWLLGTERPQSLVFSPDSTYLLAAAYNGIVYLWNVNERRLIASFAAHADPGLLQVYGVRAIAWSRSRNCLATAGWTLGSGSAKEEGEFVIKLW